MLWPSITPWHNGLGSLNNKAYKYLLMGPTIVVAQANRICNVTRLRRCWMSLPWSRTKKRGNKTTRIWHCNKVNVHCYLRSCCAEYIILMFVTSYVVFLLWTGLSEKSKLFLPVVSFILKWPMVQCCKYPNSNSLYTCLLKRAK